MSDPISDPNSCRSSYRDSVLTVACQGEHLLAILTEPAVASATLRSTTERPQHPQAPAPDQAPNPHPCVMSEDLGVLLIVGGPQYRVGCHRQFTLLGRALATGGIPCLRIDYRGMGDATGEARDFEQIDDDISAAIDQWQQERPALRRVLIWGLCDAASAALLYVQRRQDPRVAGLCLANPWVRTTESLARAQVRHYYWDRLRQGSFWRKLLSGGVGLSAVRELLGKISQTRSASPPSRTDRPLHYIERMALGLREFQGPILLMLSGDDLVAKEFLDRCRTGGPAWQGLLERPLLRREDLPEADHTFASAAWRAQVESWTLSFAVSVAAGGQGRAPASSASSASSTSSAPMTKATHASHASQPAADAQCPLPASAAD
ncbi:hydrolase 1, exosortase A system-associated [Roseateles sp. SL47]|uniref:hydrolase 1, exosortase A system-associated n=1 Tax=Roseateles sp. SL47 TaxID=2995138 RepID=UPI00227224B0|nr:hydrolase 1, exosortase A system-associated [Roseateles sp. SL47]WAC71167.1 hydrolase 1, exosortase A system-associated [Roseateles sp. SL47]